MIGDRDLFRRVAPRLELAHREAVREEQRARAHRDWWLRRELHLEWLVAHRELQLARAQAVGRRGYIAQRERKLRNAIRELAHHRSRRPDQLNQRVDTAG